MQDRDPNPLRIFGRGLPTNALEYSIASMVKNVSEVVKSGCTPESFVELGLSSLWNDTVPCV